MSAPRRARRMDLRLSTRLAGSAVVAAGWLAGCNSERARGRELPLEPAATIVELMDSEVGPSAEALWESVASITDESGFHERQPRTDDEWHELRRRAITLAEASNLIAMKGRKVTTGYVAARGLGELDSAEAQKRIDANPDAFRGFAVGLHATSLAALRAIDAKDPDALLESGGAIDAACEACHVTFWYPDANR